MDKSANVDATRRFSELYFGFASNLAPSTMKGRCPDSVFCGLARLDDWKWTINSTKYANIVPSPGDHVYGGLYFLSPRDEAGLDHSEGVPWLYEKQWHDCVRINPDGSDSDQKVQWAKTYLSDRHKRDVLTMNRPEGTVSDVCRCSKAG